MVRPVTDDDTGLKVLREPPSSSEDDDAKKIIDIAAVHGLGAHPDDTWTKKRGEGSEARWVNWLEEEGMLPAVVPNARIMRYGYKSHWFGPDAIKQSARTVAARLLKSLRRERKSCVDRPLIFIAHSFGGLVVLKALCDAYHDRGEWPGIVDAVRGLIFFGTPFRGADGMSQSEMVQAAAREYSTEDIEQEPLHILDPGNELLQDLMDDFQQRVWINMPLTRIACFFELQASEIGAIVGKEKRKDFAVSERSSCLDLSNRVSKHSLARTHFNMNKFGRPTEEDYQTVAEVVGNMVTETSQPLPESGRQIINEKRYREALVNSLEFRHIEDRYNNIKDAHHATCEWLLTNKIYQSWLDKNRKSYDHDILWLKGKPGAGKSTLIKFALSKAKQTNNEDLHISFFFNARGSLLEKDTLGMYRSLLFQLFTLVPKTQQLIQYYSSLNLPRGPPYSWTIPQLKAVLGRVLRELERRHLWIFVDALDECDEDQVRDMVVFFDHLVAQAVTSGINLRVFFASRHYPKISISHKIELILENEEEHTRDIERYIQSSLRTVYHTHSESVQRIREEVKRRASGVFIWVVLVVQILNKAYDHGRVTGLEKKLREIPDDLGKLFEGILTRDDQNMGSMRLCIQWILLAERPLTREELYFAILSGTEPETSTWNLEEISTEVMEAFILSCSKGLAELTGPERSTVQFIHETIRDFLKEKGMALIQETSLESLLGSGHNSLKQCCANYISSAQKVLLKVTEDRRKRDLPRLPFVQYALWHVFCHANQAESNDVKQASFLRDFNIQRWIQLTHIVASGGERHEGRFLTSSKLRFTIDSSLLYVLAEQNFASLIEAILGMDPRIDIEGGHYRTPLFTALKHCRYDALKALLTPDCSAGLTGCSASFVGPPTRTELEGLIATYKYCYEPGGSPSSALQFFFQWGTESDVWVLLRSGRFDLAAAISTELPCSPLSFAAARGYGTLTEFLLNEQNVDPNSEDEQGLTPLSKAARDGRLKVASLLLKGARKVDVNLQSHVGRSPLSYAAEEGHEDVLKLLLCLPDVEVNLRDSRGRTPLFYAAMRGHVGIIQCLVNAPAVDIISRDKMGHTALSYAVLHLHEDVVRQLLKTGEVDINSRDTLHGRTALSFAFEYGYQSIARLLLDTPNIDISISDNRGRTLLDFAQRSGHKYMASLLPSPH